jgi:hypothetical protein
MNCEQFRALVHDLPKRNAVPNAVAEEALAHSHSCDSCSAIREEAEFLAKGLRSMASCDGSLEAPARVEAALLRQLRRQAVPVTRRRNISRPLVAACAGVAAALMLLLFSGGYNGTPSTMPAPQALAASTNYVDEFSDFPFEQEESDAAIESFVPLSDSLDDSFYDNAAVVRVVLPRSVLESFGLASGEISGSETIADLVVTSDGVPRAIRAVGW